jgi:hypothetical protein
VDSKKSQIISVVDMVEHHEIGVRKLGLVLISSLVERAQEEFDQAFKRTLKIPHEDSKSA